MKIQNINKTCSDCDNYTGLGDWDLCCTEKHDPNKFPFGFLCYKNTPACEKFKEKSNTKEECN